MKTTHKQIAYYLSIFLILSSLYSCDYFNKSASTKKPLDKKDKLYSIEPKTTTVFWTGYKTTAKIAVKGRFSQLEIVNPKEAKTAREAIDGVEFSIPVSSLFSNNESRDTKLKNLFFGVMDNTNSLTGNLHIENDSIALVTLKMNGISKAVRLNYFIDGQMLSMEGSMNILDWDAAKALTSLHEACKEKHTGEDGVSKTWEEVDINVESYLKIE